MDYTSDEDSLSESSDSSVSTESSREEIEFEEREEVDHNSNEVKSDLEEGPYSEEPLADDEWMEEYTRERKLIEDRQEAFQNRLERVVENNIWLVGRHLVLLSHCKFVILLHMNTTFASSRSPQSYTPVKTGYLMVNIFQVQMWKLLCRLVAECDGMSVLPRNGRLRAVAQLQLSSTPIALTTWLCYVTPWLQASVFKPVGLAICSSQI